MSANCSPNCECRGGPSRASTKDLLLEAMGRVSEAYNRTGDRDLSDVADVLWNKAHDRKVTQT